MKKKEARFRDEWVKELEELAQKEEANGRMHSAQYFRECAKAISCPDRTSFHGVRIK